MAAPAATNDALVVFLNEAAREEFQRLGLQVSPRKRVPEPAELPPPPPVHAKRARAPPRKVSSEFIVRRARRHLDRADADDAHFALLDVLVPRYLSFVTNRMMRATDAGEAAALRAALEDSRKAFNTLYSVKDMFTAPQ